MIHVLDAKICCFLLLLSLIPLSACGKKEFKGSTEEGQTPILEADVSVSPLESRESPLPGPVTMEPGTLMAQFPAALIRSDTLSFTIDTQAVSTEFELKDIVQAQKEVFHQVSREKRTEKFQQGHPPEARQDMFNQQAKKGPVDILLVIDNSISMTEEQRNLSDKMHDLVASLGNSDWQIGVISTTAVLDNGEPKCEMKVIRSTDPGAANSFRSAVLAGTSGDSNEQGILQAVVGLSCPGRPWLRPHASVAVLIVSDEDNCSADGEDCRGSVAENETYLIQYVEQKLQLEIGKNAGFYGIFSPPASPCQTSPNVGLQYQRLVDYKAQGMINSGNICDASYKTTLNRISDNIAVLLGSQFELKHLPLVDSLQLKLVLSRGTERVLAPHEYSLDRQTIRFAAGFEPPAGAHLIADYLIAGQPVWKAITLAETPGADTLEVRMDNQGVRDDLFQLNDRVLTFHEAPPAEAEVRIDYGLDTPRLRTFHLSAPAAQDSLQVTLNGQAIMDYEWDANGRAITLGTAPAYDAEIAVSWTQRLGPQLTYALPVATEGSQYQIHDGNRAVPFTQNEGLFTIPAAEHRLGKRLTLRYQMPDARTRTFTFAHPPIPESTVLEQGAHSCQLGAGLTVDGPRLISTCGVKSRTEFTLNYEYYEPQTEFTLSGIKDPDRGQWTVWVNGVPTQDYVRKGSTITFPTPPAPDAQIGLQYAHAPR